jgi:thioredoxin 1
MTQNTITLTDGSWDQDVLRSDVPVLVDFWAEWCPPCRAVGPTVDAIAEQFKGQLKVGKLNVDDNGDTAMRYQVRSIPMFLLIKDGKVVEQKVGALSKAEFLKIVEKYVPAAVTA